MRTQGDDIITYLCGPYMNALIKAPWSEELSIGGEGHRVDRLRMLGKGVYAGAPVYIPEPHSWVKWGTVVVQESVCFMTYLFFFCYQW